MQQYPSNMALSDHHASCMCKMVMYYALFMHLYALVTIYAPNGIILHKELSEMAKTLIRKFSTSYKTSAPLKGKYGSGKVKLI